MRCRRQTSSSNTRSTRPETRCAFVDFAITAPWGALLLEVDENQHSHQPRFLRPAPGLRHVRVPGAGQWPQGGGHPLQPGQLQDEREMPVPPKERQRRLVEVVRAWLLEDPAPDKQLARFFMYYDGRSDSPLPVVAKEWDSEEARAVSAVVPM